MSSCTGWSNFISQNGPANALGPATLGPATLGPATLGPATLGPATLGPATLGHATLGLPYGSILSSLSLPFSLSGLTSSQEGFISEPGVDEDNSSVSLLNMFYTDDKFRKMSITNIEDNITFNLGSSKCIWTKGANTTIVAELKRQFAEARLTYKNIKAAPNGNEVDADGTSTNENSWRYTLKADGKKWGYIYSNRTSTVGKKTSAGLLLGHSVNTSSVHYSRYDGLPLKKSIVSGSGFQYQTKQAYMDELIGSVNKKYGLIKKISPHFQEEEEEEEVEKRPWMFSTEKDMTVTLNGQKYSSKKQKHYIIKNPDSTGGIINRKMPDYDKNESTGEGKTRNKYKNALNKKIVFDLVLQFASPTKRILVIIPVFNTGVFNKNGIEFSQILSDSDVTKTPINFSNLIPKQTPYRKFTTRGMTRWTSTHHDVYGLMSSNIHVSEDFDDTSKYILKDITFKQVKLSWRTIEHPINLGGFAGDVTETESCEPIYSDGNVMVHHDKGNRANKTENLFEQFEKLMLSSTAGMMLAGALVVLGAYIMFVLSIGAIRAAAMMSTGVIARVNKNRPTN